MTPDLHFQILPPQQRQVWEKPQQAAPLFKKSGFYLAGGTALALQLGHRRSEDFDFFSNQADTTNAILEWLESLPHWVLREKDRSTIHAEVQGVKLSFIGSYRYPQVKPQVLAGLLKLASLADIGLMKLLAITHRATLRDYIDLAAIIRSRIPLEDLLKWSKKKYGAGFNPMISLKALTAFHDLDQEMPLLLDKSLGRSWEKILIAAVKKIAAA